MYSWIPSPEWFRERKTVAVRTQFKSPANYNWHIDFLLPRKYSNPPGTGQQHWPTLWTTTNNGTDAHAHATPPPSTLLLMTNAKTENGAKVKRNMTTKWSSFKSEKANQISKADASQVWVRSVVVVGVGVAIVESSCVNTANSCWSRGFFRQSDWHLVRRAELH